MLGKVVSSSGSANLGIDLRGKWPSTATTINLFFTYHSPAEESHSGPMGEIGQFFIFNIIKNALIGTKKKLIIIFIMMMANHQSHRISFKALKTASKSEPSFSNIKFINCH